MSPTPYTNLPDSAFWRKSIALVDANTVSPVLDFDIKIDKKTKVATAGSCFAQHIARYLKLSNYNYYVVENGHPILNDRIKKEYNYGTFSARYGNLYTSRQLLQLFKRSYNQLHPTEDIWKEDDHTYIDPYRPNIQSNGFSCKKEFEEDRNQHFKAVRKLFETLDVFIFTLGLTECWQQEDGTVFPLCPGVAGGEFNAKKHSFLNLSVRDVVADLREFLELLQKVNPKAKVILTVSPVPLIATASNNHVLTATTYSKSVLRVAAEEICQTQDNVSYFPSYEIITGNFSQGAYFSSDLRNVTEEGVRHVMRIFFEQVTTDTSLLLEEDQNENNNAKQDYAPQKKIENIVRVICEEDLLENKLTSEKHTLFSKSSNFIKKLKLKKK